MAAPIAPSTSAGSRSAWSGTQKTPSGNSSTASAASWSASRVLPLPPGPVSVSEAMRRGRAAPRLLELALAADERRRLDRQVRPVERLERRELVVAELEEPLRRAEVLEAVLAEVAQLDRRVEQLAASSRRRAPARRGRRS